VSERDRRLVFVAVATFFMLWTVLCVMLGATYSATSDPAQAPFWPFGLWLAPWFAWAAGAMAYCNWPDRDKGRYRDD
jgi:hypothetical protein